MALDKEDCTCPICMYIMVEPVTMPCHHSLCMQCYKQTTAQSNLVCPLCRQRISVWARRASKTNTLIDQAKWRQIKAAFPQKVKRRMDAISGANMMEGGDSEKTISDDDESDEDEDIQTRMRKFLEVSKPGEIRQEYDAAMEKIRRQKELEAQREEEASAALIKALQEEEAREFERLRREREDNEKLGQAMAQQLQDRSSEERERSRSSTPGSATPANNKSKTHNNLRLSKTSRPKSALDSLTSSKEKLNTLNNFFNPVPRTPSAPTVSSKIKGSRAYKNSNDNSGSKTELSPYPYPCLSPEDKIFYGLAALESNLKRASSCSSDSSYEAPGLAEHSYSTASARVVDLTSPATAEELGKVRDDIPTYDLAAVKSEPVDIFEAGPSGLCGQQTRVQESPLSVSSHDFMTAIPDTSTEKVLPSSPVPIVGSFRPILVHQKTPPKHSGVGDQMKAPIPKAYSARLPFSFERINDINDDEVVIIEDEKFNDKLKSVAGVGKTSAAAARNKRLALGKTVDDGGNMERSAERVNRGYQNNHSSKEETTNVSPSKNEEAVGSKSDQENIETGKDCTMQQPSSCQWLSEEPLKASHCNNTKRTEKEKSTLHSADSCNKGAGLSDPKFSNNKMMLTETYSQKSCVRMVNKQSSHKNKTNVSKKGMSRDSSTVSMDSFVQRRKRTHSTDSLEESNDNNLTQEEKDHLLAVQLQQMYERLDKTKCVVDRFKGSKDEYSLRKKRKVSKKFE